MALTLCNKVTSVHVFLALVPPRSATANANFARALVVVLVLHHTSLFFFSLLLLLLAPRFLLLLPIVSNPDSPLRRLSVADTDPPFFLAFFSAPTDLPCFRLLRPLLRPTPAFLLLRFSTFRVASAPFVLRLRRLSSNVLAPFSSELPARISHLPSASSYPNWSLQPSPLCLMSDTCPARPDTPLAAAHESSIILAQQCAGPSPPYASSAGRHLPQRSPTS